VIRDSCRQLLPRHQEGFLEARRLGGPPSNGVRAGSPAGRLDHAVKMIAGHERPEERFRRMELVALTGIEPDGWQFWPVRLGLSGCVFSPAGILGCFGTPPRTADVTAQSGAEGRGRGGAGQAAALRKLPMPRAEAVNFSIRL